MHIYVYVYYMYMHMYTYAWMEINMCTCIIHIYIAHIYTHIFIRVIFYNSFLCEKHILQRKDRQRVVFHPQLHFPNG